jgi:hypothetical protein
MPPITPEEMSLPLKQPEIKPENRFIVNGWGCFIG